MRVRRVLCATLVFVFCVAGCGDDNPSVPANTTNAAKPNSPANLPAGRDNTETPAPKPKPKVLSVEKLGAIEAFKKSATALAFSPDGKLLATGAASGAVKLWDPVTRAHVRTITSGALSIWSMAFSPDGKLIALGTNDGHVKLWDVATGEMLRACEALDASPAALSFSEDGRVLAGVSKSRMLKRWDIATGEELSSTTLSPSASSLFNYESAAFSADGKQLVTGGGDGTIALWDVANGTLLGKFGEDLGYTGFVTISRDGEYVASAHMDETVRLWSKDGVLLKELTGCEYTPACTAISPDGRYVFASAKSPTVRAWDTAKGKAAVDLEVDGHSSFLAFSPDGNTLVCLSVPGSLEFWKLSEQ